MPRAVQKFEEVGGRRLPLGGVNGYRGVRGGQGRKQNKYQGVTPKKKHRTAHFDTALEAAIAFAELTENLELGMVELRSEKKDEPAAINTTSKKIEVGTYLGYLRPAQCERWPGGPCVVPTVACVAVSRQQAAAAVARGVAVAYADVHA